MPELRECPFCGGEAERIDFGPGSGDNEGGSCVACTRCQASGPVEFGYKENFVSNWNRRNGEQCRAASGSDRDYTADERAQIVNEFYLTMLDLRGAVTEEQERRLLRAGLLLRALSRGVPEDDPDGVRYRWLFSTAREDPAWPQSVEDAIDCLSKGAVDAAIDDAIAAQRKEG